MPFLLWLVNNKQKTHGGASMRRERDPNSMEIALPVNAFPVQSGLREKEKKNDYSAAVKINISISILAPKTQINAHLSIRLWQRPIRIRPWSGVRAGACPICSRDNNSQSSWVVVVDVVRRSVVRLCARQGSDRT